MSHLLASARVPVLGAALLLALLAAVPAGIDFRVAWNGLRTAERDLVIDRGGNRLVEAMSGLFGERVASNAPLQAAAAADGATRQALLDRRVVVDAGLDAAMALLVEGLPAAGAELAAARVRLAALRTRVDTELGRPRAARDAEFIAGFLREISALAQAMDGLWTGVLQAIEGADPRIVVLNGVKLQVWVMRDMAGRERSMDRRDQRRAATERSRARDHRRAARDGGRCGG